MKNGCLLVTNNPLVKIKMQDRFSICFVDGGYGDVLLKVRDMVHLGHRLYTHPLAGSIEPDRMIYRTVAVSEKTDEFSVEDSEIISNSIAVSDKSIARKRHFTDRALKDMQLVDHSLISGAAVKGTDL